MYFKYKAVHSLLQQSQSIELKYSLRYFPKGQTEYFSKAIPEPLVLPKPTRSQAPFKAEDQPWIEQTFRLHAPRPVDQIPLDNPGEPAIHLITGQPVG
ncbi:hypothetical protein [Gynuella sunshinyii]|uniref:Uncharacterized protein n=1 Tax=Gynuella sunshinyii YC6258 TaxID=1445510 RepID=A0A0C5VCR4_9GAMM|nr:hypothetical protein [Gynuella sunshinyii]AJQ92061.1 hypothetical Protein YC6258_00005 [Gynuella sunshinyii YC6258]